MLSFSMEISSVAEPGARGAVIKLPRDAGAVITDYGLRLRILNILSNFTEKSIFLLKNAKIDNFRTGT